MEELLFAPAHRLATLVRRRQISAVDLLEVHLVRIYQHNRALNAIVTVDEEGACRRAREADDALASGRCWGPLHGVPFTLKDHQDTVGMRSTMGGYPPFLNRLPKRDSTVAARLKASGAILMGKSNAVFFPFSAFGTSHNPWDLARCPGVSSSGAAAALAAGLTPLDVGTDATGSVLLPAHNCGIFGMRPTEHRVSLAGLTTAGTAGPFRNLTVFGPMARSVADLELTMSIIAGPDGHDFHVPPVPWQEPAPPTFSELRIAWTPEIPGAQVGDEICQAIENLAAVLERSGARVGRCRPEVDFARQTEISRRLFLCLALSCLRQPDAFSHAEEDGSTLADYVRLLDERARFVAEWERFFDDWDVFLCPACGVTAQPRQADSYRAPGEEAGHDGTTLPARLAPATGHPALVFPLALDATGLPIGVQLIGPRWSDERLLTIADRISECTDGFRRPPGF